ncbi:hypothetical protein M409DRAFT_58097 [Zasmidium cellare ATCC 36951]|uniref:Zn(2)-C6 fungal-type domain-containing protein n=1 Tax=Zasmidium cellare ATCC 36951 TaxID=1080233 RepID=A0A6A6C6N1_ZASCE|nr:uncharacterized protein M409DRAFT_58097 [Zasmidium cellare ATCC 36951]KAF2162685.1 hypothetical protein M409DRAFT_58097 [Zasmidium cellare ATCC 36951]
MNRSQRSRTVCYRCHRRKTACDLQLASGPDAKCSACKAVGADCLLRPSNKGRRLHSASGSAPIEQARLAGCERKPFSSLTPAYLGEMSFHTIFTPSTGHLQRDDTVRVGDSSAHALGKENTGFCHEPIDQIPARNRRGNLEVFYEFFYTWCPILDVDLKEESASDAQCIAVDHALALVSGNLRAPLTPHASDSEHYLRARQLFYSCSNMNEIDRIRTCMLFYWWSATPPNMASMDNSFWWTGLAIRMAQQIGLHREPSASDSNAALKRRIWWTLYARDRIISWCQGRPCIIDDDYCDVRSPLTSDFPPSKSHEAEIFVHWLRLTFVVGHVNKTLFRARLAGGSISTPPLAAHLVQWIRSLPIQLSLPLANDQAIPYERDVLLLHLPYLSMISLIYLTPTQSRLPGASVAAVVAAACTARIIDEFLARGHLRFLPGTVGWYIAVAVLSLMPVLSLQHLNSHALAHIRTLLVALEHMASQWHSARGLHTELSKLFEYDSLTALRATQDQTDEASTSPRSAQLSSLRELCAGDGVVWADFFPFVTEKTSPLVAVILLECQHSYPDLWPGNDWPSVFDEFFEEFGTLPSGELHASLG